MADVTGLHCVHLFSAFSRVPRLKRHNRRVENAKKETQALPRADDDDDADNNDYDNINMLCDMFSPPSLVHSGKTRKRQRGQKAPRNQEKKEVERWKSDPFFGVTEWGRGSRPAHLLKQNLGQGLPGPPREGSARMRKGE